jgi:hypothetical protein
MLARLRTQSGAKGVCLSAAWFLCSVCPPVTGMPIRLSVCCQLRCVLLVCPSPARPSDCPAVRQRNPAHAAHGWQRHRVRYESLCLSICQIIVDISGQPGRPSEVLEKLQERLRGAAAANFEDIASCSVQPKDVVAPLKMALSVWWEFTFSGECTARRQGVAETNRTHLSCLTCRTSKNGTLIHVMRAVLSIFRCAF